MSPLARAIALTMAVSGALTACQTASTRNAVSTCGSALCVVVLHDSLNSPTTELPELPGPQDEPVIRSCADLLAALRAGTDLGERMELPEFNAYSNCLAKAVIAQGRGTNTSRFDLTQAGQQILTSLDLANVPSSLAPRRPAEHYRLLDFSFRSQRIDPLAVELVADGFTYRFEVLAAGDFRGIGAGELLVRLVDHATNGGTYDGSSLLVLDWTPKGDAIVATDALDLLRPQAARRKLP